MLACQLRAHFLPSGVHEVAVKGTVGAGEIDELKDAQGPALAATHPRPNGGAQPRGIDDYYLSGFDFPDKLGPKIVQRTALGGDDPALSTLAEAEGPDAQGVSGSDDTVLGQPDQRKRSFKPSHALEDPLFPAGAGGVHHHPGDDLGIGGRCEDTGSLGLQLFLQLQGVDDIAVIGQGQCACGAVNHQGLRIAQLAGAGCGIAGMPNGQLAREGLEIIFAKNLGNQSHFRVDGNSLAVRGGDAGAFLAAMLEGEQSEEGEAAGALFRGIYGDYPAFLARTVERAIDLVIVRLTVHGAILSAPFQCGQQKKRPEV